MCLLGVGELALRLLCVWDSDPLRFIWAATTSADPWPIVRPAKWRRIGGMKIQDGIYNQNIQTK